MPKLDRADWWAIRTARNRTAAHYTCPLCGLRLHAMTDHMLLAPEGDMSRRRHAHAECVQAARAAGRLPLRDEWLAARPRSAVAQRGPLARALDLARSIARRRGRDEV
jgi:hypothetical protein